VNKLYFILIVLFLLTACNHSTNLELTVSKDRIQFHNWHPTPKDTHLAKIYVWNTYEKKTNNVPLAGQFKYGSNNTFEFVPNFPFMEKTEYVIIRTTKEGNIKQRFSLPQTNKLPLTVEGIYPTSDSLPENLLRMYVTFSQPMKTSGNLENIKLLNNQGEEIEGAIFNNVYELWDKSQKQLTIIFDPARIKTDLVANKELGRALKVREKFQVMITMAEDIYGQQLQKHFTKTFWVTPQDVSPPNVDTWNINAPESGTKGELKIKFKSPVDKMSLYTRIKVTNQNNQIIQGKITIGNHEKLWKFVPLKPWTKGNYKLKINARLADPSGNNLNGLFDHKTGSLKSEKEGEILNINFQII